MQYGPLWRSFRKLAHQNFMESVVERDYLKIQNAEAVQMLFDICQNPSQHMLHPKRFSNSIAMSLSMRSISFIYKFFRRLFEASEKLKQNTNTWDLFSVRYAYAKDRYATHDGSV